MNQGQPNSRAFISAGSVPTVMGVFDRRDRPRIALIKPIKNTGQFISRNTDTRVTNPQTGSGG